MQMPRMTARASLRPGRSRAGVAQRVRLGIGPASGFENTAQDQSGEIYVIVQNPCWQPGNHGARCVGRCMQGGDTVHDVVYVGKTIQGNGDRFYQHVHGDVDAPWWAGNWQVGAYQAPYDNCWPYFERNLWSFGGLTRFDVAVAEQYYIEDFRNRGAPLLNARNELTPAKFNQFRNNPDVFTTRAQYGTWAPGL
ncbi:MAG: hypothetical protein H6739_24295 [Alphaproteobacteria bacterium]|nr:hypothetical protein [Alphaproteobacteria bacterium]